MLVEALLFAHAEIKKIVAIQKEMIAQAAKEPQPFVAPVTDPQLVADVEAIVKDRIHDISFCGRKKERYAGMRKLLEEVQTALAEKYPEQEKVIASVFTDLERNDIRQTIVEKNVRIGGRGLDEIRPISCDLDLLPRAHGSSLFTRGETQALAVVTLGTKLDVQHIDNIQSEYDKSYMLHYNFPPFSVGEVKRVGSVSRREVGHGHLAERSLSPVLPAEKSFPYTIRLVSETLESNGSSSMAAVCSSSLALMAGGVPIKSHVAGVAMGLIKENDKVCILTDILGTEDHVGDMDFKVAGTRDGITAVQMDIKIDGITAEILKEALGKAHNARMRIIEIMEGAIKSSRKELSAHAPRISTLMIDKDKIREHRR
jgi:polyribonucleotide nucleotidyltransferase